MTGFEQFQNNETAAPEQEQQESFFEQHLTQQKSIDSLCDYLENCAVNGRVELQEEGDQTTIVEVGDLLSSIQSVAENRPEYGANLLPGKNLRKVVESILNQER